MKFIENPNLPENKVRVAIVDLRIGEYGKALERLGVELIYTTNVNELGVGVSTHPDMQILHLGYNNFCTLNVTTQYYQNEICRVLGKRDCELFNNVEEVKINKGETLKYPNDATLNLALTKKWVIGLESNPIYKSASLPKITTRQGYSKCSVCILRENAIITADESIAKSAEDFGIDVCMVSNNCIKLEGYKNGFIGGCAGKISEDKMIFYGSLEKYPDGDVIKTFAKKHDVECISLSNNELCDFGSLLPIIEE